MVQANYDIYAGAGGCYRATTRSFDVTAEDGGGILLQLVNKTANGAVLSAIEITATNASGVPAPTADLELSTDGGGSWSPLATDVGMDRWGRGSHLWTVAAEAISNHALVRVTAHDGTQPQDTSDHSFIVANNGTAYYVNDASTTGDEYTSAPGDNTVYDNSQPGISATTNVTVTGNTVYGHASVGRQTVAAVRAKLNRPFSTARWQGRSGPAEPS